jgi:hypothetical protein
MDTNTNTWLWYESSCTVVSDALTTTEDRVAEEMFFVASRIRIRISSYDNNKIVWSPSSGSHVVLDRMLQSVP